MAYMLPPYMKALGLFPIANSAPWVRTTLHFSFPW